jgi:hypothetical protein
VPAENSDAGAFIRAVNPRGIVRRREAAAGATGRLVRAVRVLAGA